MNKTENILWERKPARHAERNSSPLFHFVKSEEIADRSHTGNLGLQQQAGKNRLMLVIFLCDVLLLITVSHEIT